MRARKIAWAYRAALEKAGPPEAVSELDERFLGWGERWIAPPAVYKPDDYVTAVEGGQLLGVSDGTISEQRMRGRIKGVRDGKRYLYKVADLWELSTSLRRRSDSPTVRVPNNGRSVSNG